MRAKGSEHKAKIARQRVTAAQTRLRAIETRLMLAFTSCDVAETNIRYGQRAEARKVLEKIRHVADSISAHVGEEHHVPAAAVPQLRSRLAQLTRQANDIEEQLRTLTDHDQQSG